jgi:hypothetical protein
MARAVGAAVHDKDSAAQPANHAAAFNLEPQQLDMTLPQIVDRLEASLRQAGEAASSL